MSAVQGQRLAGALDSDDPTASLEPTSIGLGVPSKMGRTSQPPKQKSSPAQ